MRWPLLYLPLFLIGCGGTHDMASPPTDTTLSEEARAGRLAFSLERPQEAAVQYERALVRARARDDAAAIGDYGYDLAVAQLAANRPRDALATARTTRADLARRGVAAFPALVLVEATSLYRLNEVGEADRLAAAVETGNDQAAAARASFLRGLIADQTGNTMELGAALARLAGAATPEQRADADELAARRDLRRSQFTDAAVEAKRAADARRTAMDYRDMARALALAADASAQSGSIAAAADLYIQAGQSAAAQGSPELARPWLRQALALAQDPALHRTARQALAALGRPSGVSAN
jgi:hypothetical protein